MNKILSTSPHPIRKLALITGGTSGIGFGIAKSIAQDFDLALGYCQNDTQAKDSLNEINHYYPTCKAQIFKQNLLTYEDAISLYQNVKAYFQQSPLVLICSAGRLRDQLFMGSNFEEIETQIREHLIIPMALAHQSIRAMSKEKFGRILFLSSISARYAKRGQTHYSAAKSGLEGFTKTLALEVAHRGITVNAIAPGLIQTTMTRKFISEYIEKKQITEDEFRKRIPVNRIGTPDEVGSLAKYIISESSSYMTGQVLTLDGGRSLGDYQS